jgi:hypothetical protein
MVTKKSPQSLLFALAATIALAGCPREELMSIKNESGGVVTILSQGKPWSVPAGGLVTIA